MTKGVYLVWTVDDIARERGKLGDFFGVIEIKELKKKKTKIK